MKKLVAPLVLALATGCGNSSAAKKSATPAPLGASTTVANTAAAPPGTSADASDAKTPLTKENAIIAKMLSKVSKLRGLDVKRPVSGMRLGRAELIAKIRTKVDKEIPPEAIALEGDTLKLYGFIPVEMDYLDTTMKLLEAQLAGFYEPNDEHMYLAGDLDGLNGDITLAHELQHALQDQHFDLKKHSGYRPGHGDEQSAFSALCEGDATSVMIDFTVAKIKKGMTAIDVDDAALEEQISSGVESDPSIKNIPHIMRADLVAPYVYGTRFVHAMRRKGGWAAVNAAFQRPPTTTEQILHPDKWQANEPALNVAAPPPPSADWKLADDDTTGELGLAYGIGEWTSKDEGFRLAADWGGDRDATYTKGGEIANITRIDYDASAPKGAQIAQKRLGESLGKSITVREGSFACIDRKQLGPLAFAFKERTLLMVAGPAKRGTSTTSWASTASCKDAAFRNWVKAALAP